MTHTIIIKIESGAVSEVYTSAPLRVIVVDHDLIEGGESFEERKQKAVFSMLPDPSLRPEDIDALLTTLVLECTRPYDRRGVAGKTDKIGAAA